MTFYTITDTSIVVIPAICHHVSKAPSDGASLSVRRIVSMRINAQRVSDQVVVKQGMGKIVRYDSN